MRRTFEHTASSCPGPTANAYTITHIIRTPLPEAAKIDRLIIRGGIFFMRRLVVQVEGLDNIVTSNDPFILAANHSQRLEALLFPMLIAFHRKGNMVEFISDWNFRLVPGLGFILRRGRSIPAGIKSAKPKFLNYFKRFILRGEHGFELAKKRLMQGVSIGLFPEGTVNRDPHSLLRGQLGAAKLAIETGVPIIPAGIRFPLHKNEKRIPDIAPMTIEIGTPIYPPKSLHPERSDIMELHQTMMQQISVLSHKHWHPQSPRRTSHDNFTSQD